MGRVSVSTIVFVPLFNFVGCRTVFQCTGVGKAVDEAVNDIGFVRMPRIRVVIP